MLELSEMLEQYLVYNLIVILINAIVVLHKHKFDKSFESILDDWIPGTTLNILCVFFSREIYKILLVALC